MKIVAISGHAGAGKDTLADIIILENTWENSKYFQFKYPNKVDFIKKFLSNPSIVVNFCSDIQKVAFADKLKKVLSILTNTPVEFWSDSVFKDAPNTANFRKKDGTLYTDRELLQIFGTEVGRNIDEDLWVKTLLDSLDDNGFYIISDLRFKNEAAALKELGAKLIRVNRASTQMSHSSENNLDDYPDFDITIENDGTIEDLINKIINKNLYE